MLLKIKLLLAPIGKGTATAWSALWTFPSILGSAFLIAWAAEAAQFMMSQGLALAILAWLQTLPEFAVEAVIAWEAGKDPASCFVANPPSTCRSHLAVANYTGAIRLLIGLGWPMIYFVSAWARRRRRANALAPIRLDDEHCVEILGTLPPVLYFFHIWYKGNLGLVDAAILVFMYVAYLGILWRFPPKDSETMHDVPAVSRWAYTRPGAWRYAAIFGLFAAGGLLLYFTAHAFLESMLALAVSLGVSQFVFVQWVAPLLSEFPEKVSAFQWARQESKADLALMNMISSNVNQWTVLAAMIPIVFSFAHGSPAALPFSGAQRTEILLTIFQSLVAVLLLVNMRFEWWNAALLFGLWAGQFFFPDGRDEFVLIYALWAAGVIVSWIWWRPVAFRMFAHVVLKRGAHPTRRP